jgi:hypothetical protein
MEGEVCEDPHVERLIESFSFLTARIHKKLDDEFPQITEAMLSVLYHISCGQCRRCRSPSCNLPPVPKSARCRSCRGTASC